MPIRCLIQQRLSRAIALAGFEPPISRLFAIVTLLATAIELADFRFLRVIPAWLQLISHPLIGANCE